MNTPWGKAQQSTKVGDGVVWHSTASHGGFQVTAKLPKPLQEFVPFTRKAGWYEEDCDWAIVVVAFPALFSAAEVANAKRTIAARPDYYGKAAVEYVGTLKE